MKIKEETSISSGDITISIVIPVYNCDQYISQTLDSILRQNSRAIEVVIINDGSTDQTADILNKYKPVAKNLRVVEQSNQGQSSARNKGISLAKGEYILFVDSDDLVEDGFLGRILQFTRLHPNFDLINLKYRRFIDGQEKGVIAKSEGFGWELNNRKYIGKHLLRSFFCGRISPSPFSYLVKRQTIVENNLSFLCDIHYEDAHFFALVLHHSKLVTFLDLSAIRYRIRKGSITRSYSRKHIDSIFEFLEDLYTNKGIINRSLRKHFIDFYYWQIFRNLNTRKESIQKKDLEHLINRLASSHKVISNSNNIEMLSKRGIRHQLQAEQLVASLAKELNVKEYKKSSVFPSLRQSVASSLDFSKEEGFYYFMIRYLIPLMATKPFKLINW